MKIITETDRLILREINNNDFEDLFKIYSDPETMKFYPAPYDEQQLQNLILKLHTQYRDFGHCLWAVIQKSENRLIGDCGIIRQIVNSKSENEIGYHFHKNYWNQGFATEAAMACKELGFKFFKYDKLISLIRPVNLPSISVAERIGFHKIDDVFIFGFDHIVYGERL